MPIEILPERGYRPMPWKNGLGSTTEIVRVPKELELDFIWRISVASVAGKGPFSLFPGCERILMPLDGGMVLEYDGGRVVLAPFESHPFSGDVATVGGPTEGAVRDFNVITSRARAGARLEVISLNGSTRLEFEKDETGLLFSPSSVIRISGSGELQAGDSALVVNERSLEVQGAGGRVVLVTIRTL